jgi:uncharacterized YigZ family protein
MKGLNRIIPGPGPGIRRISQQQLIIVQNFSLTSHWMFPTTMTEPDTFNTIEQTATAEFKERGSKFIAYAFPVQTAAAFRTRLQELKKDHPKADHHCFAYRIGTDGNVFRSSDDGEPAGSAGKPILGQIDSKGLVNVGVIVTRYFGGTLLGIPGLVNAYKTVTSLVLQLSPVIPRQIEAQYLLDFDYTRMNEVLMVLRQCNCSIIRQELHLFCNITAGIPKSRLTETLYKLTELRNVDIKKLSAG